jgi:DNA-binding transcriptional regulator YiaG
MQITLHHEASAFGMPVILDPEGKLMKYPKGIKLLRKRLRLSTTALGAICGVSHRTVEGWEAGQIPPAFALNAMSLLPLDTVVPRPERQPAAM